MTSPYYITTADVKNRLYGKVLFVNPPLILDEQYVPIADESGVPIAQDVSYVTYNNYTQNPIYYSQGLTDEILAQMISQAETDVCHDFSPFYVMPLVSDRGDSWAMLQTLPDYQYQANYFKNAFITKACIYVCRYEFGRNNNAQGKGILDNLTAEYADIKDKLYTKNDNGRYIYPPIPKIKITGYVQYQMGFSHPEICGDFFVDNLRYVNRQLPNSRINWFNQGTYPYGYNSF